MDFYHKVTLSHIKIWNLQEENTRVEATCSHSAPIVQAYSSQLLAIL